ncbi:MAG: hypothetical protein Q8O99_07995 [bacterium]|nr:hypothetical protein [bacterium]
MKSIDYAARQKTDKKFEDQAELFPYQEIVYKFGLIHTFQISKYIYDNNPKIKLTSGKTIDIKDNVTFIAGVI